MGDSPGGLGSHNLPFIEELYAQYRKDPASVDPSWASWFQHMEAGEEGLNGVRLGPSFGLRSIFNPSEGEALHPVHLEALDAPPAPVVPMHGHDVAAKVPFLRSLAMFQDLPESELPEVARIAHEVQVEAGRSIVREGEMGRDMYIITEGQVLVGRGGRMVAELGPGDVVGEMAVLDSQPRSADATAVGPVRLLRISAKDLRDTLERRPVLATGIIRVLTRRLRDSGTRQDRVDQLIRAYRVRGHLLADLDPLGLPKEVYPELNPAYYGFQQQDLDMLFSSTTIPGRPVMRLRDIIAHLRKTYCRSIGVQFMHIDDIKIKMWLQDRMEAAQNRRKLSQEEQIRILTKLTDAEIFEQFIHKKFIGAKRFSLEGAESLIPLLDFAVETAGEHGVEEIVIGMAHRGRLNVLANIMGKSPRQIFREFQDADPDKFIGSGDVKYHLGYSSDRITTSGNRVHLSLTFNPSHLEFVNPVVLGRVRAKQDRFGDAERARAMPILIHGDAAFAGQGVVQEPLNLSELHGYRTGGALHIIVNNQVGFTTNPNEGRSTQYASDVAKMLQIPIFHVNGEHPEAVAQAITLAMEFREEFKKDVVIDMYCYRRHGHNEGDEPAFTQPLLYRTIRKRKSVREGYLDNLYALGEIKPDEAERISIERRDRLEEELTAAKAEDYDADSVSAGQRFWRNYRGGAAANLPEVDTRVDAGQLAQILTKLTEYPDSFTPHPKIEKLLEQRRSMASGEVPLDWGAGEALAFATLLVEGSRVRISGQDAQRGTFSHRHAVLHDYENGRRHVPFRHLSPDQGMFDVWNSPLSEIGVLGFEYGYSLDYPEALTIWEAQFGDFTNVAQVIIDQFLVSGEDKWKRWSGLTLLLPHGFEGQGPEHSSARLERYLALSAEDNIQVANFTTPAQFFHALRRQVLRPSRKPLIVMSPKSLLRHPKAVSGLDEFANTGFRYFLGDTDPELEAKKVRRVLLTSGKLYYELEAERERRGAHDVAILRMEMYYPLRMDLLMAELEAYPAGTPVVWVQEEPRNMGAWSFLYMRLGDNVAERHPFFGVTRPESASPATGSAAAHKKEQALLWDQAFSER
ncbi:MAG: 2-oxoglutarate dehydrogenase E1 component [Myxococcales bacterium]|nr:2-oxoglutarate dehydrogenase E1 component [Myxococcales bacterium]